MTGGCADMGTLRIVIIGLWLTAYPPLITAADTAPVSPALDPHPQALLDDLSDCLTQGQFLAARPLAIQELEAWLGEFQMPQYASLASRIEQAFPERRAAVVNYARGWVLRLRRHVDFHTEQALIALLDVELRRRGRVTDCGLIAAQAMDRVSAQRDYAWAWADAIERMLAMEDTNASQTLQYRQWQVERGLDQIEEERIRLEGYNEDVSPPRGAVGQKEPRTRR